MEYTYAALLLHKLGKDVSEEALKNVVKAAGAHIDESKVKSMIASLKGVDITKELESASLVAAAPIGQTAIAEKKEEKPKEDHKAPAAEGLSALFG